MRYDWYGIVRFCFPITVCIVSACVRSRVLITVSYRISQHHLGRLSQKEHKFRAEKPPTRQTVFDVQRSSALVTAAVWCLFDWVCNASWVLRELLLAGLAVKSAVLGLDARRRVTR